MTAQKYGEAMRYQVLGPLRATRDGDDVPLGGPQQRLVLALLLAENGRPVSTARLIDGIWGEGEPATAKKTLQGYVHHLRTQIGDSLKTEGSGYSLATNGDLDAHDFERLREEASAARETDPDRAASLLREALDQWNGAPYADLDDFLTLAPEIARLRDLRVNALGDRIDADLALGRHTALVGELEALTQEYPLHERFRAQHMTALYRAGRQVEALRSYERLRRHLADEIGLEPSGELRELEGRILSDDEELRASAASGTTDPVAVRGYELRDVVATTPSGRSYRAYQRSIGRQVTVKMLGADIADDPEFIASFLSDTKQVAALGHAHIDVVFDTWREPGAAYQVSRWFEHGSVADLLTREIPSTNVALQIVDDVADALGYAHRNDVVHGHVAASNVLLDDSGRAYLTDFVVGRLPDRTASQDRLDLAVLARILLTAPTGDTPRGVDSVLEGALGETGYSQPEQLARALRQALGVDVSRQESQPRSEVRNPYKGLQAFQETDAGDFHGRTDLVNTVAQSLRDHRLVTVVGPSGSGKSSAVKAGLLPQLRNVNDGTVRLVSEMYPGGYPFEELEDALTGVGVSSESVMSDLISDDRGLARVLKRVLPDGAELVLIIDQFEELFSMVREDNTRTLFLDSLVAAVNDPKSRLRIVLTLRADFFDRPLEHARFGELVQAALVPVAVPDEDQLRDAISLPAAQLGVRFEDGLVDRILEDIADQSGALPLLQYTLTELFDRRDADTITFAEYHRSGGVLGALGSRAEALYDDLRPSGQRALRDALLHMVTIDESTGDLRRRILRSELRSDEAASSLDEALHAFGAHRLITFDLDPATSAPTVEVAHEALLREWPRLRAWIAEHSDELVVRRRLDAAITEWKAAGEDPSYLPTGSRLAQFGQWSASTTLSLGTEESAFLEAALHQETAVAERSARIRRLTVIGLAGIAVVMTTLAAFALSQKSDADDAAADARNLAAEAEQSAEDAEANANARDAAARDAEDAFFESDQLRREAEVARLSAEARATAPTDWPLALLLATQANKLDDSTATRSALFDVTLSGEESLLGLFGTEALDAAWAGDHIVALEQTGLRFYDGATTEDVGSVRLAVSVARPLFRNNDPMVDGTKTAFDASSSAMLAAVGIDGSAIALVDIETMSIVAEVDIPSPASALRFSHDGALLAVGDADGAVQLVDTRTAALETTVPPVDDRRSFDEFDERPNWFQISATWPEYEEGSFSVGALDFSPDDRQLYIGQGPRVSSWTLASEDWEWQQSLLQSFDFQFPTQPQSLRATDSLVVAHTWATLVVIDARTGESRAVSEIPTGTATADIFTQATDVEIVGAEGEEDVLALLNDGRLVRFELVRGVGPGYIPELGVFGPDPDLTTELPLAPTEGLVVSDGGDRWVVSGRSSLAHGSLDSSTILADAIPRMDAFWLSVDPTGQFVLTEDAFNFFAWDLRGQAPEPIALPRSLIDERRSKLPPTESWLQLRFLPGGTGQLAIGSHGVVDIYSSIDDLEQPVVRLDNHISAPSRVSWNQRLYAHARCVSDRAFGDWIWQENDRNGCQLLGIEVKDLSTGDLIATLWPEEPIRSITWKADDTAFVAVSDSSGELRAWDTASWRVIDLAGVSDETVFADAVYSPDGTHLLTSDVNGRIAVRNATTGMQLHHIPGAGRTKAFSADGSTVLSEFGNELLLWDVASGERLAGPIPNEAAVFAGYASGDAVRLVTAEEDQLFVWNLDSTSWPDIACTAAGRNMTPAEWNAVGPRDTSRIIDPDVDRSDFGYGATCAQFPLPE